MAAQVIELNRDHRLAKLANNIHRQIYEAVRAWFEIGVLLTQARGEFPKGGVGNKAYGIWCKDQGFNMSTDTLNKYQVSAEFMTDHDRSSMPTDCYVIYRIAHMPEQDQAEVLKRIEAGEEFTRCKLNKEYPTKARSDRGEADMKRAVAVAEEARSGLSLPNQRKIDRAVEAERKKMAIEFARQVEAKVNEIVEKEIMITKQKQQEAAEERILFQRKSRGIKPLMSKHEYRMVVSCLHPDRARDKPEEVKLNKALAIFQKLEPLLK